MHAVPFGEVRRAAIGEQLRGHGGKREKREREKKCARDGCLCGRIHESHQHMAPPYLSAEHRSSGNANWPCDGKEIASIENQRRLSGCAAAGNDGTVAYLMRLLALFIACAAASVRSQYKHIGSRHTHTHTHIERNINIYTLTTSSRPRAACRWSGGDVWCEFLCAQALFEAFVCNLSLTLRRCVCVCERFFHAVVHCCLILRTLCYAYITHAHESRSAIYS